MQQFQQPQPYWQPSQHSAVAAATPPEPLLAEAARRTAFIAAVAGAWRTGG